MSKVQLAGNASGTGIFQIAAPNSNTDRTLTLPDATGTVQVSGNPISGTTGTFTGLVDISASGAGQIQFPASQNASSNANTLDDYEEGTWTPTITFGFSSAGQTYSYREGYYTKVGNLVTVTMYVAFSVKGSSTGQARVEGLPFTIGKFSTSGMYLNDISFNGSPNIYAEQTTSYAVFNQQPAAGGANSGLTNSNFTNNSGVMICMSYRV